MITLSHPVSQMCTGGQFNEFAYEYWCDAIKEAPRLHRKQWEFCYILQALSVAGKLGPGRRGLGFGVGKEPLVAVFANLGSGVLATDLEIAAASKLGWVDTNQHIDGLHDLNDRGICDSARFASLVEYQEADMNDIGRMATGFDFVWSACSLEHLGSITKGLDFVANSIDRLKPGGVAVHTTELKIGPGEDTLEEGGTVIFRRSDIEAFAERMRAAGHALELDFFEGDLPIDQHVDVPPYTPDKHLKLQLAQYTSTSFGLIITKGTA